MANRPAGIYFICGFFLLISFDTLAGGFSQVQIVSTTTIPMPIRQTPSIPLFLRIAPIFMFLLGVLGLYAGVTLWLAQPIGQISGFLWLGLWVAEQIAVAIWIPNGPATSTVIGGSVVRILVAGILFYYLWTRGSKYISDNNTNSSSSIIQPR